MRRVALALLAALPLAAAAAEGPHAWEWPIEVDAGAGAARLALTPEVYARITRADLLDLAAYNGRGEQVPFGPVATAWPAAAPAAPTPRPVPWYRVPRGDGEAPGERIALGIARATDGALVVLDTGPAAPASGHDLLLDLGAIDAPVVAIELALDPARAVNALVTAREGRDLATWRAVGGALALVSLEGEDGVRLERRRLEPGVVDGDYLLLSASDPAAFDAVTGASALPATPATGLSAPPPVELALPGRPGDAPGRFEYVLPGPLPVLRVAPGLADLNAVARLRYASRDDEVSDWLPRGEGMAFRLALGGVETGSEALGVGTVRDRHWRIDSTPALARAPELRLEVAPDQFLLLLQGPPPYVLRAGSASATRAGYPLEALVAELRGSLGAGWLPASATLGPGRPSAGDAALAPPPQPLPLRRWALWAVLLGAALAIVLLVLRLLKGPPAG